MTSKLDIIEHKVEEIVGELTRGIIDRRLNQLGASRENITDDQLMKIIDDLSDKVLDNFVGPDLAACIADQLRTVVHSS